MGTKQQPNQKRWPNPRPLGSTTEDAVTEPVRVTVEKGPAPKPMDIGTYEKGTAKG